MDSFIYTKPHEEGNLFFVCNSLVENDIINSHLGKQLPGYSEEVAQLLVEDLNTSKKEDLKDEKYNTSLVYCVLSTIIEAGRDQVFEIDLPFTIQWDRAYRLTPGPPLRLQELNAITGIINFLGDNWVDLPLNYSSSLEEMKNSDVPEVPKAIMEILDQKLKSLNNVEMFAVDLLFNLFQRVSITSAILWVAGILENEDLLLISYVLYGSIDNIEDINIENDAQFLKMGSRLDKLRRILELSKQKDLLIS